MSYAATVTHVDGLGDGPSVVGVDINEAAELADLRIEVVKRELDQGVLSAFGSRATDYAARLVLAALDTFDSAALEQSYVQGYRDGFEAGHRNGVTHERARRRGR